MLFRSTATTFTAKKNFPRGLVLNKEKETVKLNKNIIVTDKTKNGEKMLANVRNMKDILQVKR